MRRLLLALALVFPIATAPSRASAFVSPGFLVGEPGGAQVLAGRWRINSWNFNDEIRHVPIGSEVVIGESTLQISGIGWHFGDDPVPYKLDDPQANIVMSMQFPARPFLADAVIEVDGKLTLSVYGMNDDDYDETFVLERLD